jgi:hypothetical protein
LSKTKKGGEKNVVSVIQGDCNFLFGNGILVFSGRVGKSADSFLYRLRRQKTVKSLPTGSTNGKLFMPRRVAGLSCKAVPVFGRVMTAKKLATEVRLLLLRRMTLNIF